MSGLLGAEQLQKLWMHVALNSMQIVKICEQLEDAGNIERLAAFLITENLALAGCYLFVSRIDCNASHCQLTCKNREKESSCSIDNALKMIVTLRSLLLIANWFHLPSLLHPNR
ncbi:Homeobox protein [Dirofilaria immitis]